MTTESKALVPHSDSAIIAMITMSHGNLALAAERLKIPEAALVEKLPHLPLEQLQESIKVARLISAYHTFDTIATVVFQTLPEMTPDARAKFLLQYMDRFESMVTPPVQEGKNPNSMQQFNFNLGSPEAQDDARDNLVRRIYDLKSRTSSDVQDVDTGAAG
jgi:hypothetical protein